MQPDSAFQCPKKRTALLFRCDFRFISVEHPSGADKMPHYIILGKAFLTRIARCHQTMPSERKGKAVISSIDFPVNGPRGRIHRNRCMFDRGPTIQPYGTRHLIDMEFPRDCPSSPTQLSLISIFFQFSASNEMGRLNWEQEINFASALLLHSCTTVLIKEFCNLVVFFHRLSLRRRDLYGVSSSFVLDGFTSILSGDPDGALSELYFTNTGIGLLAVSLASSIAMNLLLSPLVLNITVTSTFAVTWIASLLVLRWRPVMPILALRRAGRFVWSDTPIVNFFSLTYIATVRSGDSTLQLKDYMIFRSIAIVELVFMKTLLAASSMEEQQTMVHNLTASEKVFIRARVCGFFAQHERDSPQANSGDPIGEHGEYFGNPVSRTAIDCRIYDTTAHGGHVLQNLTRPRLWIGSRA